MKTRNLDGKNPLWAVTSCLLFLAAIPAFGQAGGAKGGDPRILRFTAAAHQAEEAVGRYNGNFKIDTIALKQVILSAKVEMTSDNVEVAKVTKTCINYTDSSEHRIKCNGKAIDATPDRVLPAFALHEYLGILGIEDGNYQLSYKLLGLAPQKVQCSIAYVARQKGTQVPTYRLVFGEDGGQSHDPAKLKIETFGDDNNPWILKVLVATWDLTGDAPKDLLDARRDTAIEIKTSGKPALFLFQFDVSKNPDGTYSRHGVHLQTAFLKGDAEQSQDLEKQEEGSDADYPFPTPWFNLNGEAHGWNQHISVACTTF